MEHKLMTEYEKADIFMKSYELEKEGKVTEATALHRTISHELPLGQLANQDA